MQDRPTIEQLLKAVGGFLESINGETGTLSPQKMFHARVARNVMELVRRELALAPALDAQERIRLLALLELGDEGQDLLYLNRLLAQKIADGILTLDMPLLQDHLMKTTLGKLSIDQPHYAGIKNL